VNDFIWKVMIVESAQSRSYGNDFGMIARDERCNDNLQTAGTAMVVDIWGHV